MASHWRSLYWFGMLIGLVLSCHRALIFYAPWLFAWSLAWLIRKNRAENEWYLPTGFYGAVGIALIIQGTGNSLLVCLILINALLVHRWPRLQWRPSSLIIALMILCGGFVLHHWVKPWQKFSFFAPQIGISSQNLGLSFATQSLPWLDQTALEITLKPTAMIYEGHLALQHYAHFNGKTWTDVLPFQPKFDSHPDSTALPINAKDGQRRSYQSMKWRSLWVGTQGYLVPDTQHVRIPPTDLDMEIHPTDKALALAWISNQNVNDAVQAVQKIRAQFQKEHFKYSLDFDLDTLKPMQGFVQSKKGFCAHYATWSVLVLRSLGIPAHMVGGFVEPLVRDNKLVYSQNSGHAWVEFWDSKQKRWLLFDPTLSAEMDGWMWPRINLDTSSKAQKWILVLLIFVFASAIILQIVRSFAARSLLVQPITAKIKENDPSDRLDHETLWEWKHRLENCHLDHPDYPRLIHEIQQQIYHRYQGKQP